MTVAVVQRQDIVMNILQACGQFHSRIGTDPQFQFRNWNLFLKNSKIYFLGIGIDFVGIIDLILLIFTLIFTYITFKIIFVCY